VIHDTCFSAYGDMQPWGAIQPNQASCPPKNPGNVLRRDTKASMPGSCIIAGGGGVRIASLLLALVAIWNFRGMEKAWKLSLLMTIFAVSCVFGQEWCAPLSNLVLDTSATESQFTCSAAAMGDRPLSSKNAPSAPAPAVAPASPAEEQDTMRGMPPLLPCWVFAALTSPSETRPCSFWRQQPRDLKGMMIHRIQGGK